MDPPLHSGDKLAVSWVDSSKWKLSKATKDTNISRQSFGLPILRWARYFVHQLPWERKNHQLWILYSIIGEFEGRNHQKMATNEEEEKKCSFTKTMHCVTKLIATMAKLHELHFELFLHPPYSTGCMQTSRECSSERDLAPMKKLYWKLRRILRPKKNHSTKRHQNVREMLKSAYHPRKKLCWWIKSNFA